MVGATRPPIRSFLERFPKRVNATLLLTIPLGDADATRDVGLEGEVGGLGIVLFDGNVVGVLADQLVFVAVQIPETGLAHVGILAAVRRGGHGRFHAEHQDDSSILHSAGI